MAGNQGTRFSNHWKKRRESFQTLEDIGKNGSKGWKVNPFKTGDLTENRLVKNQIVHKILNDLNFLGKRL